MVIELSDTDPLAEMLRSIHVMGDGLLTIMVHYILQTSLRLIQGPTF